MSWHVDEANLTIDGWNIFIVFVSYEKFDKIKSNRFVKS